MNTKKHSKKWIVELNKACPVYCITEKDKDGNIVFLHGYKFEGESVDRSACIYKTARAAKMARAKGPRVLEFFKFGE